MKPQIFVLSDSNVWTRHGAVMKRAMARYGTPLSENNLFVIPPGEQSKSLAMASDIWHRLIERGATRRSVLVNFGGGVVTDLGGFCAAAFKRGIRFVNVPTTVLAAADAAIGGKTGIDFDGLKNELGFFAMPERIEIWPETFNTLPKREILSGFAEVVKSALLADEKLYRKLLAHGAPYDNELMDYAVRRAAEIKKSVVRLDPHEKGLRRILNLGHTAGHAYESYAAEIGRPISHGEAVAHGLEVALRLSEQNAGLKPGTADEYRRCILDRYYDPLPFDVEKSSARLSELMSHDKKNPDRSQISYVLLQSVGQYSFPA